MTEQVVCRGCDRRIEVCSFCQSDDCSDPVCYRCVTVDLGEAVRRPHEHGG